MSKVAEFKTNVMRILEQAKVPFRHHCYVESGAVSGLEVAAALKQDPKHVFKTLVTVEKSGEHFVFVVPVDSALFALVRKPVVPPQNIRIILSRLARTSFAHRRKKMFKQAAAVFGADVITAAMAAASVDPDIRAERVTVDQFIRMAEYIAAHAQNALETPQNDETDTVEDIQD